MPTPRDHADSPLHRERIRTKALEAAARSATPGENMATTGQRAHYFAHYIQDGPGTQACEQRDCPYREPALLPR